MLKLAKTIFFITIITTGQLQSSIWYSSKIDAILWTLKIYEKELAQQAIDIGIMPTGSTFDDLSAYIHELNTLSPNQKIKGEKLSAAQQYGFASPDNTHNELHETLLMANEELSPTPSPYAETTHLKDQLLSYGWNRLWSEAKKDYLNEAIIEHNAKSAPLIFRLTKEIQKHKERNIRQSIFFGTTGVAMLCFIQLYLHKTKKKILSISGTQNVPVLESNFYTLLKEGVIQFPQDQYLDSTFIDPQFVDPKTKKSINNDFFTKLNENERENFIALLSKYDTLKEYRLISLGLLCVAGGFYVRAHTTY